MAAAEDKIRFDALADEMGLEGEDKAEFIGWSMMKKGYQSITDWIDPEPEAPTRQQGNTPWSRSSQPVKRGAPAAPQRQASGQY